MKKKRVGLIKGKKKLNLDVFDCNFLEKGIGLMFSREKNAKILAFRFKNKSHLSIHSFFVFFPFIAVWTDDKNRVISYKIVKPFSFYIAPPRNGFFNMFEIPMTKKHSRVVKSFK